MTAFISFLSDYGLGDEFVGVCHGVIARRCPAARVIDLGHAIPRHDVRAGALTLAAALPYLPAGVHLAVVDPGVGARGPHARRALALRAAAEGQLLVGPDNGLLMAAAQALGGVAEAADIGSSPARLQPVSPTFHGRDVFAPVAAALAAGEPLSALGQPLAPDTLVRLALPVARVADGLLVAHVLACDAFGNLTLDALPAQLAELGARPGDLLSVRRAGGGGGGEDRSRGGRGEGEGAGSGEGGPVHSARYGAAFADVAGGGLLLYEDSRRLAALAVNRGSAAELLGARRGDELLLERA